MKEDGLPRSAAAATALSSHQLESLEDPASFARSPLSFRVVEDGESFLFSVNLDFVWMLDVVLTMLDVMFVALITAKLGG